MPVLLTRWNIDNGSRAYYYFLIIRSHNPFTFRNNQYLFIIMCMELIHYAASEVYLSHDKILAHLWAYDSFISWFPNFFHLQTEDIDAYFLGGHTWGHLWFVLHLFVYSLISLPLFRYFNRESGQRWVKRVAYVLSKPVVLLLLFPLLLVLVYKFPEIAGGNPLFYITFFICGFILMSIPSLMQTIDKRRPSLLILFIVPLATILIMASTDSWPADTPGWVGGIIQWYVDGFVPWFLILTMLAYGKQILEFSNRFLKYFAEAAYPLYILHQTFIVIIGFYVVQWEIAVGSKYALIVTLTFAGIVLVYHVLVKQTNVTRFLFGMKPKIRTKA